MLTFEELHDIAKEHLRAITWNYTLENADECLERLTRVHTFTGVSDYRCSRVRAGDAGKTWEMLEWVVKDREIGALGFTKTVSRLLDLPADEELLHCGFMTWRTVFAVFLVERTRQMIGCIEVYALDQDLLPQISDSR